MNYVPMTALQVRNLLDYLKIEGPFRFTMAKVYGSHVDNLFKDLVGVWVHD